MAPQLKSKEARGVAALIVQGIKEDSTSGLYDELSEALAAVAQQLNPEEMEAFFARLSMVLNSARTNRRFSVSTKVYLSVARALTAEDSYRLTSLLSRQIETGYVEDELLQIFAFISTKLRPREAAVLVTSIRETIRGDSYYRSALGQAIEILASVLRPEDARALAAPLIHKITLSDARDDDTMRSLARAFEIVVPVLRPEEVRELVEPTLDEIQRRGDLPLTHALIALAQQLPWAERLNLLVSVLKYPTVYGESRYAIVEAIKKHSGANAIKPPGDVWAVADWLKNQPSVDLTTPPKRM